MGVKVTLKALRANNNMTQPQLAEKLGVSVSTVQSWENKGVQPRADQISKLLQLFHVNFEDIVFL
ncbi:helix-turn-helix transcriptional regulator [Weissella confusa]|uniref:helix-turn-helix transcriptional regulator n=1 Tax=Weissella confusa TaxID=1583 RepID=UPI00223B9A7A|nr:helix-turn-helix transcriptional regulator [Weissella confusa]